MALSLLIVDDHPAFRGFARSLLDTGDFAVAGEAGDGETALEQARELQPDVVVLDVNLPGIDGFEVARRLSEEEAPPRVVFISTRSAADLGQRLTSAAAEGFIAKDELSADRLSQVLAAGG